jgi:hypothetical protein
VMGTRRRKTCSDACRLKLSRQKRAETSTQGRSQP